MMMVVVQASYVGMNISYKLVAEVGMNFIILVTYRNMFSAALMLPLALIFERKRPKLTLGILFQGFISGLLGSTMGQNFYIESLGLTSATYTVAFNNLIPVITFLIALRFKMERLALGTHAGRAKVVGTLVCIGGTMIFTFYRGHEIVIWSTDINLLRKYSHKNSQFLHRNIHTQLLGSVLALCSTISFALWLIFQYSSTALMSIMASIQSTAFAIYKERDRSRWKLGWDIKLSTALYSGVITTGLVLALTACCVRMRGSLFVSIFNPLGLLLVALAVTLLLDEKLHLGSILGGDLIVCGLYMVLWSKSEELRTMPQQPPPPPPLVETHSIDVAVRENVIISVIIRIMILRSTMGQSFYIESLGLTSATYTVAFNNLIPVITFLIALRFKMERLALGTHAGRAKVVGTLVCIGGTMIFTFYRGHEIVIWSTDINLLRKYSHKNSQFLHRNIHTQLLGSVLALCSTISFALWLIFQYSSTALMSIMASIQSTAFAIYKERDRSRWKLGWDIKLSTALYSGVITTGLVLALTACCVRMRGPLFVSIFNPLGLLLVALAVTLLLDEKLHLGSILGGDLIVCGLYTVLWSKSEELRTMPQQPPPPPPLVESHSIDVAVRENVII